ncbi:metaxin-1 isoform X3 [Oncorhynchus tshawytscha]|uniref:metaxin-1 isoform X3 n=1 Tax=Oncorhynchus tshawytscha TaxID=74940 RepID=UPI000D09BC59|nr:metaxin-1 isoform X3 [Oncorhynchus tshawytscha]
MAAPLELYCWKGDWGLPSVDTDCLTVLAYAKFAGAPLKVHKITNPWRSPTGTLPALKTTEESTRSLSKPSNIIIHLRKQKYNADYDLSAKEGADTLAFVSLLEEKLLPALIYTQWVDSKNYVDVTRRWYAENIPFPLNFLLPNRIHNQQLERLRLVRGDSTLEPGEQLEKEGLFIFSTALPGCARVHDPALSTAGLTQVLLRGFPILFGCLCVWSPSPPAEGEAAQWETPATPQLPRQPAALLYQHPHPLFPLRGRRATHSQGVSPFGQ